MADIIPMRRPVETGFVGPHQYKEYEGWRSPGHLLSPPEYESPEYQSVDLPAESGLFDPEIRPFMKPELIETIERRRKQEGVLEGLRAQTEAKLEALPEEQKPAARRWLAESRARTAPIPTPTTREEASQLAIRKIGFNPNTLDPNKVLQQQFQQTLPKVRQTIFPNKRSGQSLTSQENAYWQQAKQAHLDQTKKSIFEKFDWARKSLDSAMAQWDKEQQIKAEAVKKAEADRRYEIDQARKDREEKRRIADAQEEEDKLEWVVNRKAGLKRQVTPEKADALVKTGDWKRGRPIAKGEKPEYKPGQALEKIASAQRAKATFNKTGKIDAIMAKMFPQYTEGQKLSESEITKVNKAYDRLIKHLQGFAPEDINAIPGRSIVRTGTLNGRRVVEYDDGTIDYAD